MTRIDTVPELDALPIGSIVIDSDCDVMHKAWDPKTGGDHWSHMGTERPGSLWLPVQLIHVPGRDLVQEARGEAFEDRLAEIRSIDATVNRAIHKAKEEAYDEGYAAGFHDIDWAHAPNPYRDEAP